MTELEPPESYARPGPLRRAAAGAWHVPAAIAFLLRRPRLWPLAALPAAVTAVLVVAGVAVGMFAFGPLQSALAPEPGRFPHWLGFLLTIALGAAAVAIGALLGLFLGIGLTAPLLEWLSRRVEALLNGRTLETDAGLIFELLQSFRGLLYLSVAAPLVFLLGLVPIVGPILSALWGAHAMAFQQTDGTLTRRGLRFAARRAWHRRFRAEGLGFGLASLVILPLAFVVVAPILTVGATRLVLELEREDGLG